MFVGVTEGLVEKTRKRLDRMVPSRLAIAAVLLRLASLALAHGDDGHHDMNMEDMKTPESHGDASDMEIDVYDMPSYAGLGMHGNMIFAHIVLMVLAWVFVLPIGMLANCIFRSGY